MKCELKDKIFIKGFPVYTKSGKISARYLKAHRKANKAALEEFGSKIAKTIARIAKQIPTGEWLGAHNKSGTKIFVSKRVPSKPKELRLAIRKHEEIEHINMVK